MKAFCILVVFLLLGNFAEARKVFQADRIVENAKAFQEIQRLVAGKHFVVEINRVYPQSGFDVSRFNPTGKIIVNDSVAQGHLPFFGRAYSLPYNEGGGISFDNTMQAVSIKTIEKRKKQVVSINFTIWGNNDVYQITIEAVPDGSCSVNLTSNNRAQIAYSGTISLPEEK